MTDDTPRDPLAAQPDRPATEAQRIRNLIDQFSAGYHTPDEMPGLIVGTLDATRPRGDEALRAARLEAADGCIAIVQQSLDTVRGEDDGESRSIKTSIAAREHVLSLLTVWRAALAAPSSAPDVEGLPEPAETDEDDPRMHYGLGAH